MKEPGKRKSRLYNKDKIIEDEENEEDKGESNKDNNTIEQIYPKYPKKLYNKYLKKNKNKKNSISEISKQSYNYIYQVMNLKEQTNKKYKEDEEENKEKEAKEKNKDKVINKDKEDNKDKEETKDNDNKEENIDKIFLSSLYDLFEEYDEIIIQKDKELQYKINACIKIDDDQEIKFEIIFDKERDYFDYYPNNKNFEFKDEDEPFNHDLDIPKTDFCLLIRNFKKFKNK